jgi:tetratricopeptide (TPR) repeat protein
MKIRRRPSLLIWIALGALALRLIYLAGLYNTPIFAVVVGDGQQYDAWAQRIAGGQWIGSEIFYQTPLYPYLLAVIFKLVGHHLMAARLLQAFLSATSCMFLGLAGRRFFSKPVGTIAALLLAIYPPAIFFDGLIQKSSLDLFLMTLVLFLLGEFLSRPHWKWLIAAGVATGAFVLNRENAGILYPIVVVWLIVWFRHIPFKSRAAWAAIFTAAVAAVLLPVGFRNYYVGGSFLLTTSQFGPNFYIGNHAGARGDYEPLVPGSSGFSDERIHATRVAEEAMGRKLSPSEVSNYWLDRSIRYIRNQPWDWLRLMGRKLLLTLNATEMVDTESIEGYSSYSPILRVLLWINFGLVLPLAVFGAWHTRSDWQRLALLYLMFLGLALSVAIFYVFARYRYPMVPIVLLFAAAALSVVPKAGHYWRQWIPGLLLAVLVAIVANLPMIKAASYDETFLNLASELIRTGKAAEAIAPLQKAIQTSPHYAPLYFHLGLAFNQLGEKQEAVEQFLAAIKMQPNYAMAYGALALTLQELGKTTEALAYFADVLRFTPDSAEAHRNYGLALLKAGQQQQAIVQYREAIRLKPDDISSHNDLAGILQQQGKIQEAIAQLEVALKLKPDYAEAHSNLALALKEAGNYDAAKEHFQEALRLQPNNFRIHINLGDLLSSQRLTQEAIEQYEQAAKLSPDSAEAYYSLAQVYVQDARWNEALGSLEKALAAARAAGQSDAVQVISEAIRACQARKAGRTP